MRLFGVWMNCKSAVLSTQKTMAYRFSDVFMDSVNREVSMTMMVCSSFYFGNSKIHRRYRFNSQGILLASSSYLSRPNPPIKVYPIEMSNLLSKTNATPAVSFAPQD